MSDAFQQVKKKQHTYITCKYAVTVVASCIMFDWY